MYGRTTGGPLSYNCQCFDDFKKKPWKCVETKYI